jgi:hypothetical protein
MLPSAVVEHYNVIDHIISGVLRGCIRTMRRALALYTAKEPFRHGMAQALPLPTHPTAYAMRAQQALVPIDGLDPHDVSGPRTASVIPEPCATPPAPGSHRGDDSWPSRSPCVSTGLTAPLQTTSPRLSTRL